MKKYKVHFYADSVFYQTHEFKQENLAEAKNIVRLWLVGNRTKVNRAVLVTSTNKYELKYTLEEPMKWKEL